MQETVVRRIRHESQVMLGWAIIAAVAGLLVSMFSGHTMWVFVGACVLFILRFTFRGPKPQPPLPLPESVAAEPAIGLYVDVVVVAGTAAVVDFLGLAFWPAAGVAGGYSVGLAVHEVRRFRRVRRTERRLAATTVYGVSGPFKQQVFSASDAELSTLKVAAFRTGWAVRRLALASGFVVLLAVVGIALHIPS